jgi:hypothetical protein
MEDDKTLVSGEVSGLSEGLHGFHIHEFGDTRDGCKAAGGHYNPEGMTHGGPGDTVRQSVNEAFDISLGDCGIWKGSLFRESERGARDVCRCEFDSLTEVTRVTQFNWFVTVCTSHGPTI